MNSINSFGLWDFLSETPEKKYSAKDGNVHLTDDCPRVTIPLLDRIAGRNDVVTYYDPEGSEIERYVLVPDPKITNITVFAGPGLRRSVDIGIELEGKIIKAHVHWFEARGKVYSRKVKGWHKEHQKP